MERFTVKDEKTIISKDALKEGDFGYEGKAAEQLALYEDMHESLFKRQDTISTELAVLRQTGKKSTAKFKELMGEKLVNASILSVYKAFGL